MTSNVHIVVFIWLSTNTNLLSGVSISSKVWSSIAQPSANAFDEIIGGQEGYLGSFSWERFLGVSSILFVRIGEENALNSSTLSAEGSFVLCGENCFEVGGTKDVGNSMKGLYALNYKFGDLVIAPYCNQRENLWIRYTNTVVLNSIDNSVEVYEQPRGARSKGPYIQGATNEYIEKYSSLENAVTDLIKLDGCDEHWFSIDERSAPRYSKLPSCQYIIEHITRYDEEVSRNLETSVILGLKRIIYNFLVFQVSFLAFIVLPSNVSSELIATLTVGIVLYYISTLE